MNTPRDRVRRRTPSRAPLFRATRDLKFTQEDIRAIRAAEEAMGYEPEHRTVVTTQVDLGEALANLFIGLLQRWLGLFLLGILLASVVIFASSLAPGPISPSRSSNMQARAPAPQRQVESPSRRITSPVVPRSGEPATRPTDAARNIHQFQSTRPPWMASEIVSELEPPGELPPEIVPQQVAATRTKTESESQEPLRNMPGLDSQTLDRHDIRESASVSEPELGSFGNRPKTQGLQQENEQFNDMDEMFEVLEQKGYLDEVARSLNQRRWTEAKAGTRTPLFEEPRFDSDILAWVEPGSSYRAIDTHLRCDRGTTRKGVPCVSLLPMRTGYSVTCYEVVTLTWKLALVPLSDFHGIPGLVCTPEEGKGAR